jgi:hypothetical protein
LGCADVDQQAEFAPEMTLSESFASPRERAAAVRRLQRLEAEKVARERAEGQRVLDIDFRSGKGRIRQAKVDDLLVPVDGEGDSEPEDVFPRPVFVDRG